MSKADLEAKIAQLQARALGKDIPEYLAIHIERRALVDQLQKRFPSKPQESEPQKRRHVAEPDIKKWQDDRVAAWDRASPFPMADDLVEEAERELGGYIPRERFRKLWAGVRPQELGRRGRRPRPRPVGPDES
jgi:hypothetical protein